MIFEVKRQEKEIETHGLLPLPVKITILSQWLFFSPKIKGQWASIAANQFARGCEWRENIWDMADAREAG